MAQSKETTRRKQSSSSKSQKDTSSKTDKSTPPKLSKLQAHTGLLVTCDPALKQFLIKLNNDQDYKFIMRDLDASHLFIHSTKYPPSYKSVSEWLEHEVDGWNRKWTYIEEGSKIDD